MGAERFFTRPIIVVEFGWDLSGKKIIKLKIVHILCELFFYVMTMRFTNWYIYIIWTTTFLCVWWHFDKTVMTSLAVKKVKFKYSLIEICIYDYKCIMINWVKFITRLFYIKKTKPLQCSLLHCLHYKRGYISFRACHHLVTWRCNTSTETFVYEERDYDLYTTL